jgi:hypothetical protein
MESQARFWRVSITEYVGLLSVAVISSVLTILATVPLVVMVSITGWQMFCVFLHNLSVNGLDLVVKRIEKNDNN